MVLITTAFSLDMRQMNPNLQQLLFDNLADFDV